MTRRNEVCQRNFKSIAGSNRNLNVQVAREFHRMIFISTGNSFYVPFGNVLVSVFKWFIRFSSKEGGVCMDEHRAIYEAIMAGDADKARQASMSLMQSHKHKLACAQKSNK